MLDRAPSDRHFSAEYILDVIGAGATASSEQDWYKTWCGSDEAKQVQGDLEQIHTEGRARPAVEAAFHSEFATTWLYQFRELLFRDVQAHWRNPTYIMAKLSLNILGGLFIGFTFFKAKDSQQGTQNKLFVCRLLFFRSRPSDFALGDLYGHYPEVCLASPLFTAG